MLPKCDLVKRITLQKIEIINVNTGTSNLYRSAVPRWMYLCCIQSLAIRRLTLSVTGQVQSVKFFSKNILVITFRYLEPGGRFLMIVMIARHQQFVKGYTYKPLNEFLRWKLKYFCSVFSTQTISLPPVQPRFTLKMAWRNIIYPMLRAWLFVNHCMHMITVPVLEGMFNPSWNTEHFPPITFVMYAVYRSKTPPRLLSL